MRGLVKCIPDKLIRPLTNHENIFIKSIPSIDLSLHYTVQL